MPRLTFGVRLPNSGPLATPSNIESISAEAEGLGFDALWVHDHLTWTREMHAHHISAGAAEALTATQTPDFYEAITTLSYLAAKTQRVKLGIACLVAPCRNPVYAAKQLATLDVLSHGRLILGVGLGSKATQLAREFEVLGVPVRRCGLITDEHVRVLRALWTQDHASFHGRYLHFDDAEIYPKPLQRPHPPIWIGGWSDASARRAARLGDGWIPGWRSPAEMAQGVRLIREQAAHYGRNQQAITIAVEKLASIAPTYDGALANARSTVEASLDTYERDVPAFQDALARHVFGDPAAVTARLEEFVAAGVRHAELKFIYPTLEYFRDSLQLFARTVLSSFR